jgi:iron complex transport system substrate-binding protein
MATASRFPGRRGMVALTGGWGQGVIALLLVLGCLSPAAWAAPQRVVSLNLCTDQLAVLLLPPERIAALSWLSRDPDLSYVAQQAKLLPVVRGQAEEVLALNPDLILAGQYTTRPTVRLLKNRGIPVLELGLADDFATIREQLRLVAAALGVTERGEDLLAEMDRRLAVALPANDWRPSALSFAPGGFTAGAGTLTEAVLQAAGFRNYAAGQGLVGYGYVPVESIAADRPDLLLSGSGVEDYPSLSGRLLAHPALARGRTALNRRRLPGPLTACGGPFTAEAVEMLAGIRRQLGDQTQSAFVAAAR